MKNSLKMWLETNNVTITDFAKMINTSRASIHSYLNGTAAPGVVVSMKIRKVTGLKFSEIIDCHQISRENWSEFINKKGAEL